MMFGLLFAAGCHAQDENDAFETLEKGIEALEEGDVRDAINLTTEDFIVLPGKANRRSVTWQLKRFFQANGGVAVHYPQPSIEVDGEFVYVEGPFITSRVGAYIPELKDLQDNPDQWISVAEGLTDVHRAEITFERTADEWLVKTLRIF